MAWVNGTLRPRPDSLAPTSSELTFVPRVAPGSRALLPVCTSQRTWIDGARAGCWALLTRPAAQGWLVRAPGPRRAAEPAAPATRLSPWSPAGCPGQKQQTRDGTQGWL